MCWPSSRRRLLPLLTLGMVCLACGERGSARRSDVPRTLPPDRDALFLASARVALPPEGVRREDLPDPVSEGARLVDRYCSECHGLPTPQTHSAADWPPVVRRMWLRIEGVDASYAVSAPASAERAALLRYLMEHALSARRTALPDGPGRDQFVAICGRCHELPATDSHSAEDWGAVVARMGTLMETMVGEALPPEEVSAITGYLQAAGQTR